MIGDEYFKSISPDLFDYSIIKNINGHGILFCDNPQSVDWAVSVDISGNKFLIITTELFSDFGEFVLYSTSTKDKTYRLEGKSYDDQWNLKCNDVVICSSTYSSADNRITFVCSFNQIYLIKHFDNITLVRAYISNFHFNGLEFTKYENNYVKNQFTINIQQRKLQFKLLENSSVVKSLIASGRIPHAIMSTLSIEVDDQDTIEEISELLSNISLFLNTLTLNHNFSHVVEYESKGEVVRIEIANRIVSKYHRNVLIDNTIIRSGIKNIFESSFHTFVKLKEELDLVRFSNLVLRNPRN